MMPMVNNYDGKPWQVERTLAQMLAHPDARQKLIANHSSDYAELITKLESFVDFELIESRDAARRFSKLLFTTSAPRCTP